MDNELVHDIALELLMAERNKQPLERFTKNRFPLLSLEEAYVIQEALIQLKRVEGHQVLAPKIGITSKREQDSKEIGTPIYGYIFNEMEENGTIYRSDYIHPRIEAEIGIILSEDLYGVDITCEDVMNNIAYIFSAVDIIDSRYEDFEFKISDIVADNSSASGFVFSHERLSPDKVDLMKEEVIVRVNGEIKETGSSTNVFEHPANSVAMLARLLGNKGQGIRKNVPILTGGLTKAIEIDTGDVVEVEYTTLPTIKIEVKK